MAAPQSIAAMGVAQSVPCWMNLLVKSSRSRNVPLLMRRATPASRGSKPTGPQHRQQPWPLGQGRHPPRQHDGWMWDLTIPGNNDHDFYIQAATSVILVHNCDGLNDPWQVYDRVQNHVMPAPWRWHASDLA
jgi:hypothetical protein